jgi:hypothetical protein
VIVRVSTELLLQVVQQSNELHVRCAEGIMAEDYTVVGVRMLDERTVEFVLKHKLDAEPTDVIFEPYFDVLSCLGRGHGA